LQIRKGCINECYIHMHVKIFTWGSVRLDTHGFRREVPVSNTPWNKTPRACTRRRCGSCRIALDTRHTWHLPLHAPLSSSWAFAQIGRVWAGPNRSVAAAEHSSESSCHSEIGTEKPTESLIHWNQFPGNQWQDVAAAGAVSGAPEHLSRRLHELTISTKNRVKISLFKLEPNRHFHLGSEIGTKSAFWVLMCLFFVRKVGVCAFPHETKQVHSTKLL